MADLTVEDVFCAVADRPGVAWLDSSDGEGWSVLTWDPVDAVGGPRWPEEARSRIRTSTDGRVPFASGLLGYVGYEAGHTVERVPAGRPTPEPAVHLGRYEGAACYDHRAGRWVVAGSRGFRLDAERVLARALPSPPPVPPTGRPGRTTPRPAYEEAVRAVLELIRSGDCYQVNLTRPVEVEEPGDPVQAFRRLRRSPAAYGAFLRVHDEVAVLSNSPELYLQLHGGEILSDPIKGTRPRGVDRRDDLRLIDELWRSDKDRAELTMIVDLVRNDLSRVCRPGTVVAGERGLRTHPTLHHTHWPVRGRVREGRDAVDVIAATFPFGSVTGAPKIRACERIRELEPDPRGVYTGAVGFLADGGDATLAVAIRVAVFAGGAARYHVGGGIVAQSDPADEWEETEVKSRALELALLAYCGSSNSPPSTPSSTTSSGISSSKP